MGAATASTTSAVSQKAAVAVGADTVAVTPRGRSSADALAAATDGTLQAGVEEALRDRPSGTLAASSSSPRESPFAMTLVLADWLADVAPGDVATDVLAVDSATFSSAAAWQPRLASQPLQDLLALLLPPANGDGAPLPAIVVDGDQRLPSEATVNGASADFAYTEVARLQAFPGQRGTRPLLVVDQGALLDLLGVDDPKQAEPAYGALAALRSQVWISASAGEDDGTAGAGNQGSDELAAALLRALQRLGINVQQSDAVRAFADRPELRASTLSLTYLQALGGLAALLAVLGLAGYLQERQRARDVSYALTRRMGLSHRSHLLACGLEFGLLLTAAGLIGVTLALIAAQLIVGRLDPLPQLPPDAVVIVPGVLLAVIFGALLTVSLAAAWLTQHVADRADIAQVLRAAE